MLTRGRLTRATGEDVAVKRALAQFRREEKAARQEQRQASRKARATALRSRVAGIGRWARPVAPLLFVTGFAMYGQIAYGVDAYSPADWALAWRLAVAVGVAVAVESIALYVCWHAHDALLMGAHNTAARMRRASYLIALAVAGINYAHFADGWAPTPAAVAFALFSAAGPWLWGLHTRRAQHIQLLREGQVDSSGAVFSAERWRAFPMRTWAARRWSIDTGETDPRAAWAGYNATRVAAQEERARRREERRLAKQQNDATADEERFATLVAGKPPVATPAPASATPAVATPTATLADGPGPWSPRKVADLVEERRLAPPATRPVATRLVSQRASTLRQVPATTVTANVATPSGAGEKTATGETDIEKARRLLERPAGRPTLVKELAIEDHHARALLKNAKNLETRLPRYQAAARESRARKQKEAVSA